MKKLLYTLLAAATLGAAASSQAQSAPALKIAVIDLGKLYEGHYKTIEQVASLRAEEQKAEADLARMNQEGNAMVAKYKEASAQASNPAATAEAKARAQAEAQRLSGELQRKQTEVQSFQQNTRNDLQQRLKNFRELIVGEISKVAVDVAKRHGATLLLDKSGPTLIGVSNIIYYDASYDITEEVRQLLGQNRPASSALSPTADSADAARIVLPGASK